MDETNVLKRHEVRCSACTLPGDILVALHRDRFEHVLAFEALAEKYGFADHPLSESGVRRHFARHAAAPQYSPMSGGRDAGDSDDATTAFGRVNAELDPDALLEAGTATLVRIVQGIEREYRNALQERPQVAERVLVKFLRAQTVLAKSAKQLQEARKSRHEFRKTIPQIIQRCTDDATRSLAGVMRENASKVREDVVEYAHGRLSPEAFSARLVALEHEWPREVGLRIRAATTQALKEEEAKVQG